MLTDDLKSVLFTEEQIAKRVSELGAELTRDYEGKDPLVIGILKGASVFTTDLIRHMNTPMQRPLRSSCAAASSWLFNASA